MEPPPEHHHHQHQPNPFIKLFSQTLFSLTSPFSSFFHQETKEYNLPAAPSTAADGGNVLVKKAVLGLLGAAYVFLILLSLMMVSVVLGVGLVHLWVEEPVYIKENLYFDYTEANPFAVLDFGYREPENDKKVLKTVPVGHVCNVRLVFVMPESDYNREIGNFQVVAEALSTNGKVISRSSRPCMLHFRSLPIRLMRTFLMGIPLLLGISSEIQTANVPLLKYKERYVPRTESIRISLVPRAGTPFLPQIYESRIIVSSELPWRKEIVRRWKWTFYVWTSLYIYILLLVVLVGCFRSVMFPGLTALTTVSVYQRVESEDVSEDESSRAVGGRDRPFSETVRRWRQRRNKRKAVLLGRELPETGEASDATSMSFTRDEDASVTTEEFGDSESVCM